jgi:hypothetical protein
VTVWNMALAPSSIGEHSAASPARTRKPASDPPNTTSGSRASSGVTGGKSG